MPLAFAPNNVVALGRIRAGVAGSPDAVPTQETVLRRIVVLSPRWWDPQFGLGQLKFEDGQLSEAEGLLERAIALDPKPEQQHYLLAQIMEKEGRNVEAAEQLRLAGHVATDLNSQKLESKQLWFRKSWFRKRWFTKARFTKGRPAKQRSSSETPATMTSPGITQPLLTRGLKPERMAAFLQFTALVLSALVYLPALRYEFVHDDLRQIAGNPTLHSWKSIPGFFTHHLWAFGNAPDEENYYRPLFQCWLLLCHSLFLHLTPWGWHLGTILHLHILVVWLVYRLGRYLFGDDLTAAMGALLFALDPVHIESVAWVSGGVDPLLAVFLLGSLICFLKGLQLEGPDRFPWRLMSYATFICALLTKETAAVFPAIVFSFSTARGKRR